MPNDTPHPDTPNPEPNPAAPGDPPPPEASFAHRGTFEGAYGEGSAAAWQDEQAAQRTDRPAPELESGMGGSTTAYDPDTGFADDTAGDDET